MCVMSRALRWVVFIFNFTQLRVIWDERGDISVPELPTPWDIVVIDEGRPCLLWGGDLGLYRKI